MTAKPQCKADTKDGDRCKNSAWKQTDYCYTHRDLAAKQGQDIDASPWERLQGWWEATLRRYWLVAILVAVLAFAFSLAQIYNALTGKPALEPLLNLISNPTETTAPEPTPTATDTMTPTLTPLPPTATDTTTPTSTTTPLSPTATETLEPTATPTPTSPVTLTPSVPCGGERQTRSADGMVMVCVPAGNFVMGDMDGEPDEWPLHTVYLDAYWMDNTEVTNAQFAAFLSDQDNQQEGGVTWLDTEDENCLIERDSEGYRAKSGYGDHPAIEVSWYGAAAYCTWAGGRLPTEAEWEKAARGMDGRAYPWGESFDGRRLNHCDVNCEFDHRDSEVDDGYARTAPVGSFPDGASPYGLLDMAGNVWEWVADWYDAEYYAHSPRDNPQGPDSGEFRVLRGGSWGSHMVYTRSADRNRNDPAFSHYYYGFRCVASPGE